MNERIKELKKQAWEYTMAVHDGHIVPPLDKEVWPVDKVFDEKFAELIVKECLGIVANADMSGSWITHPKDVLYVACDQIKKHFGVEE
jgi:hypothetical protein